MEDHIGPGGVFKLARSIALSRLRYGAMQLAGVHVWGPPKDLTSEVNVLRQAVERGGNHIYTADRAVEMI